jgi:hypothetical protein
VDAPATGDFRAIVVPEDRNAPINIYETAWTKFTDALSAALQQCGGGWCYVWIDHKPFQVSDALTMFRLCEVNTAEPRLYDVGVPSSAVPHYGDNNRFCSR